MKKNSRPLTTKAALAGHLEISRPTLDKFLSMPGAPRKTKSGYDLAAVAAFIADNSETEATAVKTSSDLKQARVKEIHLRCARLALHLNRERGMYVLKSEVAEAMKRILSAAPRMIEEKLVNEYPSAVAGLDVPQARIYGRRLADSLVSALQEFAREFGAIGR